MDWKVDYAEGVGAWGEGEIDITLDIDVEIESRAVFKAHLATMTGIPEDWPRSIGYGICNPRGRDGKLPFRMTLHTSVTDGFRINARCSVTNREALVSRARRLRLERVLESSWIIDSLAEALEEILLWSNGNPPDHVIGIAVKQVIVRADGTGMQT